MSYMNLEQLGETRFSEVEWVERTGSTNADLRERAEQGSPEGIVLVADYQTQGRGRRDRKWESPPKASLLVSLLLRPNCLPEEFAWLTHMAGLAVADVCRETTGAEARLKWPNDVVVGDMKLAGVLAEAVPEAPRASGKKLESTGRGEKGKPLGSDESGKLAVVLGIGVNVSWPDAKSQPSGFNNVPVSLKALAERTAAQSTAAQSGASQHAASQSTDVADNLPDPLPSQLPDRSDLLVKLLCNFEQRYARVGQPDWSAELRAEAKQRSATLGRRISVAMTLPKGASPSLAQNEIQGIAEDITASGSLLVAADATSEEPANQLEITAGDVVHLRSEAG